MVDASETTMLYVWEVRQEGRWATVAMQSPGPDGGQQVLPLIHHDLEWLRQLYPVLLERQARTADPLRLVRYELAEVLQQMDVEPADPTPGGGHDD